VSGEENWVRWLEKKKIKQLLNTAVDVDKKRVFVDGESAEGHAAVTAMWLNAEKKGPNIPIDVALLWYPMVAHYKRNFGKDGKQN
jgi:hypothetical protein